MKRFLLIGLAIIAVAAIAGKLWYSNALGAAGGPEQTVVIADGTTTERIAESLQQKRLIKSALAFRLHVKFNGLAANFKQGRYQIAGDQPAGRIAVRLTEGPGRGDQFTIKEGVTQSKIAAFLGEQKIVERDEFKNLQAKDFPNFSFLQNLPAAASLDGFLFPETYQIPNQTPDTRGVAETLLKQFDQELTPELRGQIAQSGRTLFETVIIASIVEVEVRSDQDRRLVAGILYRRLREDIRLDADATTRYALDKPTGALTRDDLDSDNPYNTRRVKGLPPGPISNPGLSALKAAINPEASEFLFYLSASDGRTIFAKNNAEHEANIEQYLR